MSRTKKLVLLAGDVILLYAALAATLLIRYQGRNFEDYWRIHLAPFSLLFIGWLFVFMVMDLYRERAFVNYNSLVNRIMTAVGIAALVSIVLFYLFQSLFQLTPKTNLFLFAAVVIAGEYLFRSTFLAVARFRPSPAIVIGRSPEIEELLKFLKKHPHAGYEAAAWIEEFGPLQMEDLPRLIEKHGAHTLIIQPSLTKDPAAIRALYDLLPLGVTIVNFTDFYELVFERVPLGELEEGWFLEHVTTRRPGYDLVKRFVDFVLGVAFSVALIPLTLLIAFLIKLTSRGPAIFAQARVGKNDETFTLYKFRTMTTWQGGNDGTPAWTEKNDRRVTPFGKLLRLTHLDEIPQLWNVVRGDISFTGPRPERVELVEQYRAFPYYNIRHVVKPGLTGWAQINFRPSASLDEAREKLKYDIYYVKNRSFLVDLAIILKTAKYLFVNVEAGKHVPSEQTTA